MGDKITSGGGINNIGARKKAMDAWENKEYSGYHKCEWPVKCSKQSEHRTQYDGAYLCTEHFETNKRYKVFC